LINNRTTTENRSLNQDGEQSTKLRKKQKTNNSSGLSKLKEEKMITKVKACRPKVTGLGSRSPERNSKVIKFKSLIIILTADSAVL